MKTRKMVAAALMCLAVLQSCQPADYAARDKAVEDAYARGAITKEERQLLLDQNKPTNWTDRAVDVGLAALLALFGTRLHRGPANPGRKTPVS